MRDDPDIQRRSAAELVRLVGGGPRAPDLIERAGSLELLSRADPFRIASWLAPRRTGLRHGRRAATAIAAGFELGRRVEQARQEGRVRLGCAAEVADWASPRIGSLAHEELWLVAVDGRGNIRAARCLARGGMHGAAIRASDALRTALQLEGAAFLLVHNHPSGDPTPSQQDIAMTAGIGAAAAVVGVPLLDHVVVARSAFACVPFEDRDGKPGLRPALDGSAR
jgi:DNA repair protein RadC